MNYLALCIVALAAAASAIPSPARDKCPPKPPTVPDFDLERYLGVWYNPQNVPSPGEQPDPVCQRAQYGSFENGTISLYNSGSYASGEFSEICGWAEQADPENNPGELYIYFPAVTGDMAGDYWVIDTDYDTFASVYSCASAGPFKIEIAYILTREKNPSEETVQLALDAFDRNGIFDLPWQYIPNADDCVYDISPSCNDDYPSQ